MGTDALGKMGQHLEAARVSAAAAEDAGRKLLALLDEGQARREALRLMITRKG